MIHFIHLVQKLVQLIHLESFAFVTFSSIDLVKTRAKIIEKTIMHDMNHHHVRRSFDKVLEKIKLSTNNEDNFLESSIK
jgi:hypothetical protein